MRESRLERKLCELGISPDVSAPLNRKLVFRLYFPCPRDDGVEYTAARAKDGSFNFVGLVLGQGGSTLQRIQRSSGTKIEIHGSNGNLNGSPPEAGDSSLHAVIFADTQAKLNKAAMALRELLQPSNTQFKHFEVKAGGVAVLEPIVSMDEDHDLVKQLSDHDSQSNQPMQCSSLPCSPAKPQYDSTPAASIVVPSYSTRVATSSHMQRTPMDVALPHESNQYDQPAVQHSKRDAIGQIEGCQLGWNSWKYDSACAYASLTQATQSSISQIAEQSHQQLSKGASSTQLKLGFDPLSDFQVPLLSEISNLAYSSGYTSVHNDSGSECSTICNALDLHAGYTSVNGISSPQHDGGWGDSSCETEDAAHVVEELLEILKVPLH